MAEVAHLALVHEVAERAERLVDVGDSSGRWIWYRSMKSVPSRRRLFSTSRMIQRRDPPRMFGSLPIGEKNFVASTTSSRRPSIALPTISSDSPAEYTSAVSMKLMPASSAVDDPHRVVVVGVAPLAEHHGAQAVHAHLTPLRPSVLISMLVTNRREPDDLAPRSRRSGTCFSFAITRGTLDRRDAELVRSCYWPAAYDDHGPFKGTVEEFVDWVQEVLAYFDSTMHFIGNQLVEVDGDTAC